MKTVSLTLSFFLLFLNVTLAQKPQPKSSLEISLQDFEKVETIIQDNQKLNKETNQVLAIYGLRIPVQGDSPKQMATNYLLNFHRSLNLQFPDLRDLSHYATRTTDAGHVVRFNQSINGFPVNNADVAIHISPQNQVTMVSSSYEPFVKIENFNQNINAQQAIDIAMDYINPSELMIESSSRSMIYHNSNTSRLAHEVVLVAVQPHGEWHVFVDPQTSEIFKVEDMMLYCSADSHCRADAHTNPHSSDSCSHGNPKIGKGKKRHTSIVAVVDGSGLVFDPDPLSSNTVAYGGNYSDNNDATNVDLDNARFNITLREIDETAGVFTLNGPWAEIRDHDSPNNGLFTQNSGVFDFNREEDGFEAVNCYFHLDSLMRYVNVDLGCVAEPFQYSGGVRYDPHGFSGADNSSYSGAAGTLQFGEGCVDDGEDSDVIHHELGHFLHDMVTNGNLSQVEGLSEGCGDYIAQSYNRAAGFWTPADDAYHWVFNWDGHNACWNGRVTNNTADYPGGLVGQVHADGSIWSTCMMTVFDEIGREATDKIFYEGLGMTTNNSSQDDAANAVYQAAIDLNYSSTDIALIHASLTECGYTLPVLDGPPVAAISESATTICLDDIMTIDYFDESTSSPNTWLWTFEGGTPATSTSQNPTVSYATEGVFDVSLEVTNANGSDMIDLPDHITTLEGANCPSCTITTDNTIVPISEVGSGNIYTSTINIPSGGLITDVNVPNITGIHTYLGDLSFTLISPANTRVQLNERTCGTDEDFNVGFDDAATTSTLPCPYTDGMLYIPFESLSAFNGEDSAGDWILEITDHAGADGGELQSWQIEICADAPPPNCDTDLIVMNPVTGTYQATNSIISSDIIPAVNTVVFISGNYIELLEGFEVKTGAVFTGEIGPCP